MKWSFLLFSSFLCLQAIAQYPATGNKMRLGWQTTGDGLVYRGAIGDTTTLDPSGINNAWMLLDTASGNLYAYRAKAWRLVSGGGGGGGLTMPFDSVTFNVNETDASLRELKYSEEKGYLQYGGQDSVQIPILPGIWYVRNDTSVTIPKGTVLRATGTLGASGRIKVKHMIANGSIDAMYILGIAMQDIAVGADGYAMSQGKIRKINTQAYSEGAVLYADVDTLGGLTQTEPTGSNLKLPIAFVVNSASNGTIAVRVTSGAYMRDLHDAEITSPVSNASLYYNAAQGVWRDTGAAVLVADTAAMLTNYINVVDTATMLSSYISNADTSVFARDFQISGTTNRLAMFTGSNTVGNSNIYQDSVGKIGIGINPSYKFQMFFNNSVAGVKDTLMDLYSANWYPVGVRSRVSNQIANGSYAVIGEALNGHYEENVGVYGIATKSDISGPGVNIGVKGEVSGTYNGLSTALGATYGGLFINNVRKTLSSGNVNIGLRVITDSAGTYGIYQNGFGANYFQGNVGIATSSPSRPLHVAGTTAIRIPVGNFAQRGTSGAGDIRVRNDTANLEFHNGTTWQTVINNSDTSVFARDVQISGTANRLAMFTGSNAVGNSVAFESGRSIFLNNTSSYTGSTLPTIELSGNGSNFTDQPQIASIGNNGSTSTARPYFVLVRSAGTTAGSTNLVPYNNYIGSLIWSATDGSTYRSAAEISAITDSITGASDMPTALFFGTTANGAASPTERMRITSAGNVGIATSSPSRPLHVNANSSMIIPSGATGTRPASGASGDIRFNSDSTVLEFYDGTGWRKPIVTNRGNGKGINGAFFVGDAQNFADVSNKLFWTSDKLSVNVNTPVISDSTLYVLGGAKITGGLVTGTNVGIGTSTPAYSLDVGTTNAVRLPVGNTSERPSGAAGAIRYNTDSTAIEFNNGTAWKKINALGGIQSYEQEFLNETNDTLTVTVSGGALPLNKAQIKVLQNGVELLQSLWGVSGQYIILDPLIVYNSSYTVRFYNTNASMFTQDFTNTSSSALAVTVNGGILPDKANITVNQNGLKLLDSLWSKSGSTININSSTYYAGSSFTVNFIVY